MNDRILFRSDSLTEAAAELNKLIEALEDVSSGLSRVNTSEDWWSSVSVRTSHGKQSALEAVRTLRRDTDKAREYVSDINSGIQKAKSMFTETDKEITRMVTAASTGTGHEYGDNSGQTSVGRVSFVGDPKPRIGVDPRELFNKKLLENAFKIGTIGMYPREDLINRIKTGAQIIKGKITDCVSSLVKDYEAKGTTYRIVKGIGAVTNIVLGSATVISAIAGTGVTAGLGAPATIWIGTYGANTAVSGFADLYNCITGDVDKIGEVDVLKNGMSWIGGQTGKLLGNEKLGKSAGEAIYTIGGLATTVVSIRNLAGQIKQSPTAGKTLADSVKATKSLVSKAGKEVPDALSGLGYIATKVDVRDIPYNIALLSKQVPNICKVASEIDLVKRGVESGKKLIDAGVEVVNTLTGCETLKQPVFFNKSEQIKKVVTFPSETVNDIKDNFGKIKDGLSVMAIRLSI